MAGWSEHAELWLRGRALLTVTGGPSADFNIALIDGGVEEEAAFVSFLERLEELSLPAVFMASGAAAEWVLPQARKRGLTETGLAPLMVLEAPVAPADDRGFTVERVRTPERMAVLAGLIASAFDLDRGWVARAFAAPSLLQAPDIAFFIASQDGVPQSAVTTTGGETVGVWSMATPARWQRRGAGRSVLSAALAHHSAAGARRFYLMATPAGKPLYDALGFRTVEEFPVLVSGPSGQFSR